jgi:hypothetical protein
MINTKLRQRNYMKMLLLFCSCDNEFPVFGLDCNYFWLPATNGGGSNVIGTPPSTLQQSSFNSLGGGGLMSVSTCETDQDISHFRLKESAFTASCKNVVRFELWLLEKSKNNIIQ